MSSYRRVTALSCVLMLFGAVQAGEISGFVDTVEIDGQLLSVYTTGAPTVVSSACDYTWWYGCSPTSVGMIIGHYDREGYGSDPATRWYPDLVPGGTAELETFVGPPTGWNALASSAIASQEHVDDFYSAGYDKKNDDVSGPFHDFNCLADFMGTSQDSTGNNNGSTSFYYFTNGAPFTAADAYAYGVWDEDGMYGVGEYITHSGYGYLTLYSQYIYGYKGNTLGFTLSQYQAEIDAGRPVIIQVEQHSMCGVGYEPGTDTIYVLDTWSAGPHAMIWGGSYSGLDQYGVMVLELSGGVPEPSVLVLLGLGALLATRRRRR